MDKPSVSQRSSVLSYLITTKAPKCHYYAYFREIASKADGSINETLFHKSCNMKVGEQGFELLNLADEHWSAEPADGRLFLLASGEWCGPHDVLAAKDRVSLLSFLCLCKTSGSFQNPGSHIPLPLSNGVSHIPFLKSWLRLTGRWPTENVLHDAV